MGIDLNNTCWGPIFNLRQSALLNCQLALLIASSSFVLHVLDSFLGIFLNQELYLDVFWTCIPNKIHFNLIIKSLK